MNIGILKRETYRNTGIETFQKTVCTKLLEHSETEEISYKFSTKYPFSVTLERLRLGRKIKKIANSGKFDKIFVPSQDLLSFNPKNVEAEIIVYVHDIIPVTTNFSGWFATFLAKHYTTNIEKLDYCIAASKHTAEEIKRRTEFTGEIDVVYQGVDKFKVGEMPKDIDLIYVGSLIPRKNPQFVKDAVNIAMANGYNCVAVNHEELDLPCKTFTDISDNKLAELYSRSKFILNPSLAEGFGRTPVEAQQYGCIPLVLQNDVNAEVLGQKHRYSFEDISMPKHVLNYLESERLPNDNTQSLARENADYYEWDKTVKRIQKVLMN